MVHTVTRFYIKRTKQWAFVVKFVEDDGYTEIERFDHADDAYGFCSWLNGGERPALRASTWDRVSNPPLPESDDE